MPDSGHRHEPWPVPSSIYGWLIPDVPGSCWLSAHAPDLLIGQKGSRETAGREAAGREALSRGGRLATCGSCCPSGVFSVGIAWIWSAPGGKDCVVVRNRSCYPERSNDMSASGNHRRQSPTAAAPAPAALTGQAGGHPQKPRAADTCGRLPVLPRLPLAVGP